MPLRLLRAARLDVNLLHPELCQAGGALAPLCALLDRFVVARAAAGTLPSSFKHYAHKDRGVKLRGARAALARSSPRVRSLPELAAAAAAAEAAAGDGAVKRSRKALALKTRRRRWLREEQLSQYGACKECGEPLLDLDREDLYENGQYLCATRFVGALLGACLPACALQRRRAAGLAQLFDRAAFNRAAALTLRPCSPSPPPSRPLPLAIQVRRDVLRLLHAQGRGGRDDVRRNGAHERRRRRLLGDVPVLSVVEIIRGAAPFGGGGGGALNCCNNHSGRSTCSLRRRGRGKKTRGPNVAVGAAACARFVCLEARTRRSGDNGTASSRLGSTL